MPTLATLFREHGYRTGAFVASAVLHRRYGLDRGFEVYDDEIRDNAGRMRSQRPGNVVCDRALEWLEEVKDEPFMAWVHFYDPHTPYEAPSAFTKRMGNPYDAEVAFMDANIRRLLDWLKANDLLNKTLIVAVADHGESLGEHGYEWHSLLVYDSIMHVPLIFCLPDQIPRGRTCVEPTELVADVPTIVDLMGWRIPESVSGVSLAAVLRGRESPSCICYGESDYPFTSFGWSKLRCMIGERWKYIQGPVIELYDRTTDPGELTNLADTHPEVVEQMEAALVDREEEMVLREAAVAQMDAAAMQALKSLGYVGNSQPLVDSANAKNLKNPKDMVHILVNYRMAEAMLGGGRIKEAIALLEPSVVESPESFVVVETLGKAYTMAGRLEEGRRTLLEALALCPDSAAADTYEALAKTLAAQGRFEKAIEACERVLEIEPSHKRAGPLLEKFRAAWEARRKALATRRERWKANPDSVEHCLRLANPLYLGSEEKEAIIVLREGLSHNPDSASLANSLAWILATSWNDDVCDGVEAVKWAKIACRGTQEKDLNFLDTLAAAYAEAGRFDDAVAAAERAVDLAKQNGETDRAAGIAARLRLYENWQPYHEP